VHGPNTWMEPAKLRERTYSNQILSNTETQNMYRLSYIAAAATAPPITAKPRKPPRIRSLAAPPVCVGVGAVCEELELVAAGGLVVLSSQMLSDGQGPFSQDLDRLFRVY
jgi:hypothetical protein